MDFADVIPLRILPSGTIKLQRAQQGGNCWEKEQHAELSFPSKLQVTCAASPPSQESSNGVWADSAQNMQSYRPLNAPSETKGSDLITVSKGSACLAKTASSFALPPETSP